MPEMTELVEAARNRQLDDETKITVLTAAALILKEQAEAADGLGWERRASSLHRCVSRIRDAVERLEVERVRAERAGRL